MHIPDTRQRGSLVLTTWLLAISAQLVLVPLPAYLVLDRGLGPAAVGALVGIAGATFVLVVPVGRYLTHRTPGRRVIVVPAALAAALAPVLLVCSTAPAVLAVATILGAAALGAGRPAWQTLTEASASTAGARLAGRLGRGCGLLVALAVTLTAGDPSAAVQIGAGTGVLAAAVLVLAVEDRHTPLAPRCSATLQRARQALAEGPVRRATALAALLGLLVAGSAVALVVALGRDAAPAAPVLALGLAGFVLVGTVDVLAGRTATSDAALAASARALVEHALVLGAASAALWGGLWGGLWSQSR